MCISSCYVKLMLFIFERPHSIHLTVFLIYTLSPPPYFHPSILLFIISLLPVTFTSHPTQRSHPSFMPLTIPLFSILLLILSQLLHVSPTPSCLMCPFHTLTLPLIFLLISFILFITTHPSHLYFFSSYLTVLFVNRIPSHPVHPSYPIQPQSLIFCSFFSFFILTLLLLFTFTHYLSQPYCYSCRSTPLFFILLILHNPKPQPFSFLSFSLLSIPSFSHPHMNTSSFIFASFHSIYHPHISSQQIINILIQLKVNYSNSAPVHRENISHNCI